MTYEDFLYKYWKYKFTKRQSTAMKKIFHSYRNEIEEEELFSLTSNSIKRRHSMGTRTALAYLEVKEMIKEHKLFEVPIPHTSNIKKDDGKIQWYVDKVKSIDESSIEKENSFEIKEKRNDGLLLNQSKTKIFNGISVDGVEIDINKILNNHYHWDTSKKYHINNLRFRTSCLTREEIKALEKFKKSISNNEDLFFSFFKNIFGLQRIKIKKAAAKTLGAISRIKDKVLKEMSDEGFKSKLENYQSQLLTFQLDASIGINQIEELIIRDLKDVILQLSSMDRKILYSRIGYGISLTLEELGKEFKVTRERIRQKEMALKKYLFNYMRVSGPTLLNVIIDYDQYMLETELNELSLGFVSFKEFKTFINEYCGQNIIEDDADFVPLGDFKDSFANIESPIAEKQLIDEMGKRFGHLGTIDKSFLKNMVSKGLLNEKNKIYYPEKLPKHIAVAHVLLKYPEGLHWEQINKLINQQKITKNIMNDYRGLQNSDNYIYLFGHGVYRHKKYFHVQNQEEYMKALVEYLRVKSQEPVLLYNDYYLNRKLEINYYDFRELVVINCKKYGCYFKGNSSLDVVSLDANLLELQVNQETFIYNFIKSHDEYVHIQAVADIIKSKSLGHAGLYLENLVVANKIVRVGKGLYTTKEKILKSKNINGPIENIVDYFF